MSQVVTRFAPSPSGHLHVGGARTALFCWAYARGRDGRFILRIEDTDQKRSSDAAVRAMLESLCWLGLDWDEGPAFEGQGGGGHGPYFQSQRLAVYDEHIERLIAEGKAYRAFETPEELDAARAAARARKANYRYDRAALRLDEAVLRGHLDEGRPHVVRFRLPEMEEVVVRDELLGEVRTPVGDLDDFVIRKADGFPMYNFAVVVDDALMEVTHVIRAQEHLTNTARQVLLQEALGFPRPAYAHVSKITNPDRSKMSKRDKDRILRAAVGAAGLEAPPAGPDGAAVVDPKRFGWWLGDADRQLDLDEALRLADVLGVELPEIDLEDFRRAGYLPEVLMNYLALLGWSPGQDIEKFDRAFLLDRFDLDRLIKSSATFDRDKLLAFNLDALQQLDADEFERRLREHCRRYRPEFLERLSDEQFRIFAAANHPRAKTLDSTLPSSRFFIVDDDAIVYESSPAVRKALAKGQPTGCDHLEAVLPVLEGIEPWTVAAVEAAVTAYAEEHADGKLGKIAQPLRIAVSGGPVSPAIFETLAILGRGSVIARVRRCLANRAELCGS